MFTVIVTGSRDLLDGNKVWDELEELLPDFGPLFIRHGACPTGADRFASIWCNDFYGPNEGVFEIKHPANWDLHGKAAGPIRNREMVHAGADLCLAFPLGESRGTWNCVNECKKAGIPVKVIK
ncbi:SLOG family protein [Streptomyces sp. NPDC048212]|uniref:SLOG family protein n=1 Tax=Streptomyces sp. NPDC048212 TaxID=3156658 RepID=UPI00340327CB